MITTVRLVAKQHRFELALVVVVSLVAGLAAGFVTTRLAGVGVPPDCAAAWLDSVGTADRCTPLLEAFGRIYFEEAGPVLASMAVLPFAVGLLAGVPVVGRELETGTAQFAWGITPSRVRWLARQLLVVGLILLVAVGFASITSEILEATRAQSMLAPPFQNHGLHGAFVLARACAALAVGLFVGALTGRSLPAFIVGAIVMAILFMGSGLAREGWASSQPTVVIDGETGNAFDGQVVGLGWLDQTGTIHPYTDGASLAPPTVEGDVDEWLMANGYEQVQLGITVQTARAWVPIEVAGWLVLSVAFLGAGAIVVSRRRPT
jgi:hypothetical protein